MINKLFELSIVCPLFFLTSCSTLIPDMLKIVSDTVNFESHKTDDKQDIDIHISLDLDEEELKHDTQDKPRS